LAHVSPGFAWWQCGTGTIRTALIWRVDWCECHPATATRWRTTIHYPNIYTCLIFFFFCLFWLSNIDTPSIMRYTRFNEYHSNRTDLLFRLIPLPPSQCHSLIHCHLLRHCHDIQILIFFPICLFLHPSPSIMLPRHSVTYQNDRTDLLFRLPPLPPSHCHPLIHRHSPNPIQPIIFKY
jgi:hypothetical protein